MERARRVTGDRAFISNELGRLCSLEGRHEEARRHYRKSCKLNRISAPLLRALHGIEPDPNECTCDLPRVFAGAELEEMKSSNCTPS